MEKSRLIFSFQCEVSFGIIFLFCPFRQSRNPVKQLAARTDLKDTYSEMSAAIAFAEATEEKEVKRVEKGKNYNKKKRFNIRSTYRRTE